ncbi:MAG TPA: M14 family metallopeptidase, partial [Burkholderiales bacterium]|nr:M14 family metallopeptidase [Burkholderiales bacterium]
MKPTFHRLPALAVLAAACLVLAAMSSIAPAQAQTPAQTPPAASPAPVAPKTTAEATDYAATSTYADVMAFIRGLQRLSPLLRVETLATTAEGRAVPLVVIGRPLPQDPLSLRAGKRIAVYIEANIHAGEVEGKEASLMLARDILLDPKLPYLDKIVLLIAPIFNADGNEKMSPDNRRGQNGPEKAGVRHNGQNLDLNRDAMKQESPEIQGLVRNGLLRWDPVLLVDCHTTDGSYHEEPVTYSWPLCPNGDLTLLKYMRDRMLPAVAATLDKKYHTLSLPYGDPRDFRDMSKGWQTFGHQPRYVTNYIGLRNRLSILDENYNDADFKTRVLACYNFLRSILDYSALHADELARLVAEADQRTVERGLAPKETDTFGLDIEVKELPDKVTVRGYEVEITPREGSPFPQMKRTDRKKTYVLPYFADFVPKRTVRLPYAYLIPLFDEAIVAKLRGHGLAVEKLTEPVTLEVEAFRLKEVRASDRLYQGHRMNQVKGETAVERREFPRGTLVVRMAQPLGNLAAYLLEPESDDGLLLWNAFDKYIAREWGRGVETYPVYKLYTP